MNFFVSIVMQKIQINYNILFVILQGDRKRPVISLKGCDP